MRDAGGYQPPLPLPVARVGRWQRREPTDGRTAAGAGLRVSQIEWPGLRRLPGVLRTLVRPDRLSHFQVDFPAPDSGGIARNRWAGLDDVSVAAARNVAVSRHRRRRRPRGIPAGAMAPPVRRERATVEGAGASRGAMTGACARVSSRSSVLGRASMRLQARPVPRQLVVRDRDHLPVVTEPTERVDRVEVVEAGPAAVLQAPVQPRVDQQRREGRYRDVENPGGPNIDALVHLKQPLELMHPLGLGQNGCQHHLMSLGRHVRRIGEVPGNLLGVLALEAGAIGLEEVLDLLLYAGG